MTGLPTESPILANLAAAMAAMDHLVCPCGHHVDQHKVCEPFHDCKANGCHDCACDLRVYETQQNSVTYEDTGEHLTLRKHLDRKGVAHD